MPGRLSFRILGPLEIERDGLPLAVRGSKLRGLAALLLVNHGDVVSTDSLIDALWGDDPPATARTSLQVQVSKLRKLLDGDRTARLETRDPGYILRIDPEQLDLHRFERLVEEGRGMLAAGEPEWARGALGRALDLWRGQPLAGLNIPGLPLAELADLEARRFAALGSRLEADLDLGRHAEVILELEGELASRPFDEGLHALAALALYRAGRPSDALEIISRLRRALSGELGINPGPSLERLEQRILNRDPELDVGSSAVESSVREGRKTVTAMVCRMAGHQEARPLDPEVQRGLIEAFVDATTQLVEAHGGVVQDALGGRVAAVFGIPRMHEDDASRAVRVASDLLQGAGLRAGQVAGGADASRSQIALRAGIAAGEVLFEDSEGGQNLLSGDPLELADELARAARPGEVLLNQTAARLVQKEARAEPAETILLTEDGPSMVAFRLTDLLRPEEAGRRLRSPLVGREEELAVLRHAFGRITRERSCSIVTVIGPEGVGKSRLVSEFLSEVRPKADVLAGRCLPYGRDITFWPVAEIVKTAAAIGDEDELERARDKIRGLVEGEEDAEFIEEQIAALLGLSGESPVPDEIFWSIRKCLEAAAKRRPLVVVFDDVQWAEATLLDLVEHIAAWTGAAPILLICLARPELVERRPGWGGGRIDATNLMLGTLNRDQSSELIDNLVGHARFDEDVGERIMAAAEGNPLFIEELLAMLIDEGKLRWSKDGWVADSDLSNVPIPPTVVALLGARLDRLSIAQHRVLELASIVGKDFAAMDLEAFGPDANAGLDDILEALVGKDLILPQWVSGRGGRAFRFRHILIQNVVYQGMPKEARARAHEAFGMHIERRAGDRLAGLEEIIGYHLEAAHTYKMELGLPDEDQPPLSIRAAARLASAGRAAFARDDMPAAASLLGRTLALIPEDDPRCPELFWRRGVALYEMGRLDEAGAVFDRGLNLASRVGDEAFEWRLRIERMEFRYHLEPERLDVHAMEQVARAAMKIFERLGDRSGMARAYRLLGDAEAEAGRHEDAAQHLQLGLQYALDSGDEYEANQKPNLGVVHGPIPAERAIEISRGYLERARRPNPDGMAGLGLLLAMTDRMHEARAVFEEGLARARQLGAEWKTPSINMHYGAALLIVDDAPGAEAVLRPAVEAFQRIGERAFMSTAVAILAEALYREDKDDEAMLASLISEDASATGDVASHMAWRSVRAKVLARRGELREAERLAREAVAYADAADLLNMGADAHLDLATVLESAGRGTEATAEIEAAIGLFERKGNVVSAARARDRLLGLLASSPGRSDEAEGR
ncbi:MAG: BTAD domain-containing putative transcriptional regulator [Actinomycetota bacterium]